MKTPERFNNAMKGVKHKLKVVHIPQVPMEGFEVEVNNENEAYLLYEVFANQHLFLFEKNVIPDYCNAIFVLMYEDGEWGDYYNDNEMMEWDELIENYTTSSVCP